MAQRSSRGADVVADEADGRVQLPHALAALAVVFGVHELRGEVDVHVLLEPLDDTEGGVAEERVQVRTRARSSTASVIWSRTDAMKDALRAVRSSMLRCEMYTHAVAVVGAGWPAAGRVAPPVSAAPGTMESNAVLLGRLGAVGGGAVLRRRLRHCAACYTGLDFPNRGCMQEF